MIIAIDGPAASGKGTLARRLAETLGYAHLDSGALYRAVALAAREAGLDPADAEATGRLASALDPRLLTDPRLRHEEIGRVASQVARHPAVRAALLDYQRRFAHAPPGGAAGAVIDGRDIGTVVCPDADVKIYLTASSQVRAQRRSRELAGQGKAVDEAAILADIIARDAEDSARPIAPLKPAPDAVLLDSSNLDIEAALAAALAIVKAGHHKR
ncbi:MAG: (d)CMP kinase [Pseudomonadota bacterium]